MNLIDLKSLSHADLWRIITLAQTIARSPGGFANACRGRILASLFFEPSTRTQQSFQAAMLRLGGQVIGFSDPGNSSAAKGESLSDTIRVVAGYSDAIVMRHPKAGAAFAASLYTDIPIINAGDGTHEHPTQTLADIVTLASEKQLDGLTIGVCGDLLYGRTVHSLIEVMSRFDGNRFVLISTPELSLPRHLKALMDERGCPYSEVFRLDEAISALDVLYMTRIQKERFDSPAEYERQKGVYTLTAAMMALARPDMLLLHPLPRVGEIEYAVDGDPRAKYFAQTKYGMFARMALLSRLINDNHAADGKTPRENHTPPQREDSFDRHHCYNPNCVTTVEKYLPPLVDYVDGRPRCKYCENEVYERVDIT